MPRTFFPTAGVMIQGAMKSGREGGDMEKRITFFRLALIVTMVGMITMVHHGVVGDGMALHMIHRELYFIPILLASFWGGLGFGLSVSVGASFFYAIPMVRAGHGLMAPIISQVLMFNLVAFLLGWLVDRKERQQEAVLNAQNLSVLGRAAAVIGHEMKELFEALRNILSKYPLGAPKGMDAVFMEEMRRLEQMVENLSSFVPEEDIRLSSQDLNIIIAERVDHHRASAKKAGINLDLRLDPAGCPSHLDSKRIGRVLDTLISNAMDVSEHGQSVEIQSRRGGEHCLVEVRDHGPGISSECLPRIFSPFFTTKPNGQGLALAGGRKLVRDMGGDIQFENCQDKGALFTLVIPRPNGTSPRQGAEGV